MNQPAIACAQCRFYVAKAKDHGECRAAPPMPLVVGVARGALGKPTVQVDATHPPVLPAHWCGQHRPRLSIAS